MKMRLPLILSLGIHSAAAQSIISLSGSDWTLNNPEYNISCPASLPSQAHLDLQAAQIIGDPYYGLNDYNLRWTTWTNWTYTGAPIAGLKSNTSSTWLLFNGLDTFASISFCGQHVAAVNNQFRQYFFDVSEILLSCTEAPVLSMNFGSAPSIADAIANEPGQETWPFGVQITNEFPNRWFIRKEQSDFGWDWGPAFAPAGPWQPAWIIQLQPAEVYVRNSLVDIYRQGQLNNLPPDQNQPWVVNASLDTIGSPPKGSSLEYVLIDSLNNTVSAGSLRDTNVTNTTVTGVTTIPQDAVKLWWPNNLGPQTLYNLTLRLLDSQNHTIATVDKRVGFRTIVLNEGPITEEQLAQGVAPGNNWHFEVNGHEFYSKGENSHCISRELMRRYTMTVPCC